VAGISNRVPSTNVTATMDTSGVTSPASIGDSDMASSGSPLVARLFAASLFAASLFEASLFEASLFEASLFEASLFAASLFAASLFAASLLRTILSLLTIFWTSGTEDTGSAKAAAPAPAARHVATTNAFNIEVSMSRKASPKYGTFGVGCASESISLRQSAAQYFFALGKSYLAT
jgi:hypothetical protein